VLRRQAAFLEEMAKAGVIDSIEYNAMAGPIAAKCRALEALGPSEQAWPRADSVLHSLPYFACLPTENFSQLLAAGHLYEAAGGEAVWNEQDERAQGPAAMAIVVRGLVHASGYGEGAPEDAGRRLESSTQRTEPLGEEEDDTMFEERLLGSGRALGLLSAVTQGRSILPGNSLVVAHNLRRGIVKGAQIFTIPRFVIEDARERAAAGNAACQTMMLEMHRAAASQVIDVFNAKVLEELAQSHEAAVIRAEIEASAATTGAEGERAARSEDEILADVLLHHREELWMRSQRYAQRRLSAMRRHLSETTVVNLDAYTRYQQHGHIVLLSGAVQFQRGTSPPAGAVSTSAAAATLQTRQLLAGDGGPEGMIHAPAVLPLGAPSEGAVSQHALSLLSGHGGAVLVVWPVTASSLIAADGAGTDADDALLAASLPDDGTSGRAGGVVGCATRGEN
jgi:hypothetical protein